jgi:hypothetical protein
MAYPFGRPKHAEPAFVRDHELPVARREVYPTGPWANPISRELNRQDTAAAEHLLEHAVAI